MAALVKEVRHEGTLPGKTLSRYLTVTSSYFLHSTSFALWGPDVELEGPVTLVDGRLGAVSLALEVADATTVSVQVEDHAVTVMNHFSNRAQNFTYIIYLNRHGNQSALVGTARYNALAIVTDH